MEEPLPNRFHGETALDGVESFQVVARHRVEGCAALPAAGQSSLLERSRHVGACSGGCETELLQRLDDEGAGKFTGLGQAEQEAHRRRAGARRPVERVFIRLLG